MSINTPEYYRPITADVLKYMAVMSSVKLELVKALEQRASYYTGLAAKMTLACNTVTSKLPGSIDPLAVMFSAERSDAYEIDRLTEAALLEILSILDVAVTLELECGVGEEEMLQAIAVIGAELRPQKAPPHLSVA